MQEFHAQRGSVTAQPPGISWYPSSYVGLEELIPQYTHRAQTEKGRNICGQVSLSMILETYTNIDLDDLLVDKVNDALGMCQYNKKEVPCGHPSTTIAYTLGRLLKIVAPTWEYAIHWTSPSVAKDSSNYSQSAVSDMKNAMTRGRFIISLTSLRKATGTLVSGGGIGHWVVVTGLSKEWSKYSEGSFLNWVRVNNPYNNAVEYYPWKEFNQSMLNADTCEAWRWLEVWKPRQQTPRLPPIP